MKNRALNYAIGIALAGILITLLVAYAERTTFQTYQQNFPFITLADYAKTRVTQAHLWLEELMEGEGGLVFDKDVKGTLSTTREVLQGAYDGKETAIGSFGRIEDEDIRALLKQAVFDIEKLNTLAAERWTARQAAPDAATTGTDASELAFNETYKLLMARLDQLADHVDHKVKQDVSYLSLISWVSILLVLSACAVLCTMLYRLQRGNAKMEAEIRGRVESQDRAVSALSGFIESISSGKYDVALDMGDADTATLSTPLLSMRDKLRKNAEDDRRRNWANTGLAQVGEILRATTATPEELYDSIIKFVVKYTKSNQGGLFILNEEEGREKILSLVACYAFERKKYLHKEVTIGEGLVGQCYLEGQRIYLLEVPSEYVSITSGLGGATPNALLIVPLKVNDKIFGVLELATFGQYENYEIDLVEKLAESIASTISTVRVNESTRILLERTQQQAEEMRAQEEEMRQNMEELEATQEEMRRKEKHIQEMLEEEKKRSEFNHKSRQLILDLSKDKDVQSRNSNAALEKITSTIARHLHVSRCSIWMYHPEQAKIYCEKLYIAERGTFELGTELFKRDFPDYFAAITAEEIIMARDAATHKATHEFADVYLRPLDIHSMLDVPFFTDGHMSGVICCEHQGEAKDWNEDHVEFLKSCADLVTVTFNTRKINNMLDHLQDAQETLQAIIDNLPRAVFWKDRDLKFQGCNRIFAQVAGMNGPADLIGQTDFDMPWREHAEAYRADDLAVMQSRKARLDQEERNVNSEGVESWVLTSKVPVLNAHGEVVAVLGMFEDITPRKRREAEVEARMAELESLRKLVASQKN